MPIAQGQDVRSLVSFFGRPPPWVKRTRKHFPLPASLRAGRGIKGEGFLL